MYVICMHCFQHDQVSEIDLTSSQTTLYRTAVPPTYMAHLHILRIATHNQQRFVNTLFPDEANFPWSWSQCCLGPGRLCQEYHSLCEGDG